MVLERAVQIHRQNPSYDNNAMIKLILKCRQMRSVFQLLDMESAAAIDYESRQSKNPDLTWSTD
jgi:hypothetical protein